MEVKGGRREEDTEDCPMSDVFEMASRSNLTT